MTSSDSDDSTVILIRDGNGEEVEFHLRNSNTREVISWLLATGLGLHDLTSRYIRRRLRQAFQVISTSPCPVPAHVQGDLSDSYAASAAESATEAMKSGGLIFRPPFIAYPYR